MNWLMMMMIMMMMGMGGMYVWRHVLSEGEEDLTSFRERRER